MSALKHSPTQDFGLDLYESRKTQEMDGTLSELICAN